MSAIKLGWGDPNSSGCQKVFSLNPAALPQNSDVLSFGHVSIIF